MKRSRLETTDTSGAVNPWRRVRGRRSVGRPVCRAETAGFCMGVILALQKLDALIEADTAKGPLLTLGPIIHNPQVLEEYACKGVAIAEEVGQVAAGATVVVRAHGVPKEVQAQLREQGALVIDATCPKVKRAQLLIENEARKSRMLLLYGDESHPEVKGLLSYAEAGSFVFDTREKLAAYPLQPGRRYCLAAQTTQDKELFEQIREDLQRRREGDVTVLDTICDATRRRQEEAVCIARDVDFMIVVGGYSSGNTRRLAQVVAAEGTPCLHVETADELSLSKLRRYARIGLTGGASTPKKAIDEIQRLLESLL